MNQHAGSSLMEALLALLLISACALPMLRQQINLQIRLSELKQNTIALHVAENRCNGSAHTSKNRLQIKNLRINRQHETLLIYRNGHHGKEYYWELPCA